MAGSTVSYIYVFGRYSGQVESEDVERCTGGGAAAINRLHPLAGTATGNSGASGLHASTPRSPRIALRGAQTRPVG